jgi:uncharacterized protein with FMN-binding domain
MKKIIVSAVFILAFGLYIYTQKINIPSVAPETKPDEPDNNPTASDTTDIPVPVNPSPDTKAIYKDGEYTGKKADAYYGNLQVKAIINAGKITDVQFLEAPTTPENSIKVNGMAKPLLTQEAITAQSADVDGVSGATFSSKAFKESLADALSQAKN